MLKESYTMLWVAEYFWEANSTADFACITSWNRDWLMWYIYIFIQLFYQTTHYTRMLFAELGFEEKTINAQTKVHCILTQALPDFSIFSVSLASQNGNFAKALNKKGMALLNWNYIPCDIYHHFNSLYFGLSSTCAFLMCCRFLSWQRVTVRSQELVRMHLEF